MYLCTSMSGGSCVYVVVRVHMYMYVYIIIYMPNLLCTCVRRCAWSYLYGVATVSRIDKITGLFCSILSLLSILLTKATPYVFVCGYIYMPNLICTCAHRGACSYIYVYICLCICICICICMYMYEYVSICMYINIYIYMYTYKPAPVMISYDR